MRIFLVRHGESISNVDARIYAELSDHVIPLSDIGQAQALKAGTFLKDYLDALPRDDEFSTVRIWTSPYRRTRETADGIEKAIGSSIALDRREHINLCEQQFGLFDGVTDEELPVRFPNEYAHYKKCIDHEENFGRAGRLGKAASMSRCGCVKHSVRFCAMLSGINTRTSSSSATA